MDADENPLQSQVPFNLSLKFSRLQITEVDTARMSVDSQSVGKSHSQILEERRQSSVSQSNNLGGLRRKKRTFRELERWQIFDEHRNNRPKKHLDLSESEQDCVSHKSQRQRGHRGSDLKTLKFNSQLLQKASAAVDLIS